MSKSETAVSIDIETNGPVPGLHSMLSLGAAAFDQNDEMIGTWYQTIRPLEFTTPNQDTMDWWQTQPEAWAIVNLDQRPATEAISSFVSWIEGLHGNKVAVAWPAAFDFPYVNYYCWRFCGRNPLGFACLDIRSYANGLARSGNYYGLREEEVRGIVGDIDRTGLRPHVAVDDAIEQGRLYVALRRYAREHGQ